MDGWMDGIGPPFGVVRTYHYTQPQLRVLTSNGFKVLKSVVYFDLFTVVSSVDVILKSVLPNEIKKKINFFSKN